MTKKNYIYIFWYFYNCFEIYTKKNKGQNWVTTITMGFEEAVGSVSGVNA
jgi:hypothetical protein